VSDALLKPEEVAALLRKSRSWVYAACERGEVPHVRIGRDLRFRRADLDRWLDGKTARPAPATLKGES
jgi:excisionase family DNA binding protein